MKKIFFKESVVGKMGFFMGTGLFSGVIYVGLVTLFIQKCHLHYLTGVTLAYLIGLAVNFLINKWITFNVGHEQSWPQIKRFIVVALMNYGLTVLTVRWCVESLHIGPYWGAVIATLVTSLFGFFASHYWVFKT